METKARTRTDCVPPVRYPVAVCGSSGFRGGTYWLEAYVLVQTRSSICASPRLLKLHLSYLLVVHDRWGWETSELSEKSSGVATACSELGRKEIDESLLFALLQVTLSKHGVWTIVCRSTDRGLQHGGIHDSSQRWSSICLTTESGFKSRDYVLNLGIVDRRSHICPCNRMAPI